MTPAILEDVRAFAAHVGVVLYPWQADAFGAACERAEGRFRYRLAAISVPRGNGKSWGGAVVGLWRLLCGPPRQDIISAALDFDGAKVVLEHARQIVRSSDALSGVIEVQANGIVVPSTGSRWTVTTRDHTASRGRHATLVIYDEVGWARDDELFSSLLAGQASIADPFCLVISTVGRRQAGPLWTVKQIAEGGDDATFWWWSGENRSPKVTAQYLERQRRILVPAQYAREHGNQWVDAADSFVSVEDVDRAMGGPWREQPAGQPGVAHECFVDLGITHDPTVIAVGHEDGGTVYVDVLQTFQGSKRRPVEIAAVEEALLDLAKRFSLRRIRVESWQGIAVVQRLEAVGLPVEVFTPTPKSNAEEWPQLAQRLAAGTVVMFPHARLREELLNLTVEVGPSGAKVVDRGRVHQDHAVAVRGIVASLGAAQGDAVPTFGNMPDAFTAERAAREREAMHDERDYLAAQRW